jgi:DNA-binding protein H-NS
LKNVWRSLQKEGAKGIQAVSFSQETAMARPKSFAKMSIEALVELRDSVAETLSEKASDLRRQLSSLTGTDVGKSVRRGRPPGRRSSLKGRRVAPKYRSKKNPKLTWAGRGIVPRWMRQEMKAAKLKKEAFLIK